MAKVTAIVPNYNHERYLERRIGSVLDQTYQDLELLLLDDASTDGSARILNGYRGHPRVRDVIINEANTGIPFKQWNKGVAAAQGEYIWLAESDDFADPRLVERLVEKLDAHPNVGVAYAQSLAVDENDKVLYPLTVWTDDLSTTHWRSDYVASGTEECAVYMSRKGTIPNASGVLFRRSAFQAAGGAEENYRLSGDWITWAKLLMVSDVAFVSEGLNFFRMHPNTVRKASSRGAIALTEAVRILQYIAGRVRIPADIYDDGCNRLLERWIKELELGRFGWRVNAEIYGLLRQVDSRLHRRLLQRLLGKASKRVGIRPAPTGSESGSR